MLDKDGLRVGGGWVGGWFHQNNATSWLHLASWNLPDSQLSWVSKMEPSVAKRSKGGISTTIENVDYFETRGVWNFTFLQRGLNACGSGANSMVTNKANNGSNWIVCYSLNAWISTALAGLPHMWSPFYMAKVWPWFWWCMGGLVVR